MTVNRYVAVTVAFTALANYKLEGNLLSDSWYVLGANRHFTSNLFCYDKAASDLSLTAEAGIGNTPTAVCP